MTQTKMAIVIRKDLGMGRGKEIAQGAHAALDFLIEPLRQRLLHDAADALPIVFTAAERHWLLGGMTKVCLKVSSEAELLAMHERALAAGLKSYITQDSGKTVFCDTPTFTACAVGPDEASRVDAVTGGLPLY